MWSQRTCVSSGRVQDHSTDWSLEIDQCYHLRCKQVLRPTISAETSMYCLPSDDKYSIDLATYRHSPVLKCHSSHMPIENLCSSLNRSLWISTKAKSPSGYRRTYPEMSDHDRKILHRMAAKRRDNLNCQANASVANHFWAFERSEREKLKREHAALIKDSVQISQAAQQALVVQRRQALMAEESCKRMQQRQHQTSKDRRSEQRVEWMRSVRNLSIARRGQLERDRSNYAQQRRSEVAMGDAIQVERCWTKMSHRLDRAERLRQQLSEDYRQRLLADNELQAKIHASKLNAAKLMESEQADVLKQHIREQDRRSEEIARQKRMTVEESRAQAHWTAELREEVRRSASPEKWTYLNMLPTSR